MAVDIVYETHSLTTDNEAGRATGWLPGELSESGRGFARELGRRRPVDDFAVIFCSDLARAVETVETAYGGWPAVARRDHRLRECDYGELTGMPVDELARQRRARIDAPFPGGESYRQVVDRTAEFLRDLAEGWDGRRVLLVSHSANRWALDHLLHGRTLADLVDAPFGWQEGWSYRLPDDWRR
ncbi:histidine phosphatase family protein [Micromonospora sp. WMMD882]|uniref:histidine phosphatase family protein n=1 Tax=Micromonospora sp. WMMD882 TaxID=3015151 RepID=UPI00248BD46F|nr:histidine phosphatase family protein [Micromonospora sp. WMMD882]WBB81563.1 histidine phosphatase family protein [Micromonospora sp. WMMD882]